MIKKILKLLLSLLFLTAGYGAGVAIYRLTPRLAESLTLTHPFLIGALLFLPVYFLLRKRFALWGTMEHELTHALTALLFFRRVERITAGLSRGETEFSGRGSACISLAPYFLPTLALAPLALRPLLTPRWQGWLDLLLGILFCYYLLSNLREAHPAQPDLQRHGLFFSYSVILPLNLILLFTLFLLGTGNGGSLGEFLHGVLAPFPQLLTVIGAHAATLFSLETGGGGA